MTSAGVKEQRTEKDREHGLQMRKKRGITTVPVCKKTNE
jgi:hypothetical protein